MKETINLREAAQLELNAAEKKLAQAKQAVVDCILVQGQQSGPELDALALDLHRAFVAHQRCLRKLEELKRDVSGQGS